MLNWSMTFILVYLFKFGRKLALEKVLTMDEKLDGEGWDMKVI